MTSIAIPDRRPMAPVSPARGLHDHAPVISGVMAGLLLVIVLVSLLMSRQFASWAIGAFSLIVIAAIGRREERLLLITLVALSVMAGGEQMMIGLRGTLFFAAFVLFARYVTLNPWFHLVAQLVALLTASLDGGDAPIEVFLYGPSILLIILSTELTKGPKDLRTPSRQVVAFVFNVLALLISSVGYGSRSAGFVWLMANLRRLGIVQLAILGAIMLSAVPLLVAFRDLPVVEKLGNSVNELMEPVDIETGAVSQRGIENLMFVGYLATATPREFLLGSTTAMLLDGAPLGQDKDVKFIPHNQIFGSFFQFGIIGCAALLFYLVRLCRYFAVDRDCMFMLIFLLLLGFVLKAGFYDADLGLLAATLNWVRHRTVRRLAGESPVPV